MNVFEKIEADHQRIRGMLEDIDSAGDSKPVQQEKYDALKEFLLRHHQAEQDTFFAELVQHSQSRDKALHLVEEHGEHKKVLEQLDAISPSNDDWDDKIAELKHDVLHHIDEEEADAFALGREVLADDVSADLGARMGQIEGGLASRG